MICGLQIGLAIFGLIALIRGKMTISKSKVIVGTPARLIGLLALVPIPLTLGVGMLIGIAKVAEGGNPEKIAEDNRGLLMGVEIGIVIVTAILVFGLGAALGVSPAEAERRDRAGRYDEEDDEYEDARPRRRRDRDEDDEEDDRDDRPRRRSRDEDDDEGDGPLPRNR